MEIPSGRPKGMSRLPLRAQEAHSDECVDHWLTLLRRVPVFIGGVKVEFGNRVTPIPPGCVPRGTHVSSLQALNATEAMAS